jgi:hypothetical protein
VDRTNAERQRRYIARLKAKSRGLKTDNAEWNKWNDDVEHLAKKVGEAITGYAATHAFAAMARVMEHIAYRHHDHE